MSNKGCFDRDGISGSLKLKSFKLKIKGLSEVYEYKEEIPCSKWKLLIKFMKRAIQANVENP